MEGCEGLKLNLLHLKSYFQLINNENLSILKRQNVNKIRNLIKKKLTNYNSSYLNI